MSRFDELVVGEDLPGFEREISCLQLFRFSAITWNPHRIHYDKEHAQEEGHPDILIQGHFHGALLQELVMSWAVPEGRLVDLSWRNVGRATGGSTLSVQAEVTEVDQPKRTVTVDAWTEKDGQRCADGTGRIVFEE